MGFEHVAAAGGAMELAPWSPVKMAIGTQIAQADPAAIHAGGIRGLVGEIGKGSGFFGAFTWWKSGGGGICVCIPFLVTSSRLGSNRCHHTVLPG